MGKVRITIEINDEKEIYEGDIFVLGIANKEDYKIGQKNIHLSGIEPFDLLRVYNALGVHIYHDTQENIYGSKVNSPQGCKELVEDLIPSNLEEFPWDI